MVENLLNIKVVLLNVNDKDYDYKSTGTDCDINDQCSELTKYLNKHLHYDRMFSQAPHEGT